MGGGVIFNPKIYDADFGNFKQEIDIKRVNSGFRVCFFNKDTRNCQGQYYDLKSLRIKSFGLV